MKRKKLLTAVLALSMAGTMLMGCGDKTTPVESSEQTSEELTTPPKNHL